MDLSEFYGTFFDEAQELLQDMETRLLALDVAQPDGEALNAIFRATHSIKGGAATFGVFEKLVQTTHTFENVLDDVRNNRLPLTREAVDIFLHGKDVLTAQVNAYREGRAPDGQCADQLISALSTLSGNVLKPEASELHTFEPETSYGQGQTQPQSKSAGKPGLLDITFIGVAESDRLALQNELSMMGDIVSEQSGQDTFTYALLTDVDEPTIRAICGFVIDDDQVQVRARSAGAHCAAVNEVTHTDPQAALTDPALVPARALEQTISDRTMQDQIASNQTVPANPTGQTKESATIRVATQRVDQLVNQIGEVVIDQAILIQACRKLDPIEHAVLLQSIEHMSGALRGMQESVMALRMVPMDYAFGRYPRVVREIAARLQKKIELKTLGGATEMDKGMIEKLIDPLTHLVRNSLDHGIETSEVRKTKGKNPVGQIRIAAFHEGGRIVIEVSDDGAGLNREAILSKAAERGMPVSAGMSDSEVYTLIFAPGFSTARTVTDVSGRGVGLDVVRRNIQEIGGQIQIESQSDVGTTLRISLPLTLAIMDGMSIQVGAERFVMPLNHIAECLQPDREQLYAIGSGGRVLRLRGEHLPVLRLGDLFDIPQSDQSLEQSILVVIQVAQMRYALAVDQILGQHQVVVKSLEKHYERVPGASGATILGDGSVALILDAGTLPELGRAATGCL